jgi:hypothetical protein
VKFPADVLDFITLGNVQESPLAVDRLINGATSANFCRGREKQKIAELTAVH